MGDLPAPLRDAARQATQRSNDVLGRLSGMARDYGFADVRPLPAPRGPGLHAICQSGPAHCELQSRPRLASNVSDHPISAACFGR